MKPTASCEAAQLWVRANLHPYSSPKGRVFKIALKSCAFFTYCIDALDHQIWRKVFIRPFLNVTVSSFLQSLVSR